MTMSNYTDKILGSFSRNRRKYRELFLGSETGKDVLKDLANFCHQNSPTYVAGDPHASAYKEGMRRVFLRIQNYLALDEDQMRELIKSNVNNRS